MVEIKKIELTDEQKEAKFQEQKFLEEEFKKQEEISLEIERIPCRGNRHIMILFRKNGVAVFYAVLRNVIEEFSDFSPDMLNDHVLSMIDFYKEGVIEKYDKEILNISDVISAFGDDKLDKIKAIYAK